MLRKINLMFVAGFIIALLVNCSSATPEPPASTNDGTGTLQFVANGEDFIRAGFTSKDGWQVAFDNAWVNLTGVAAYQSSPPYDPDEGANIEADEVVELDNSYLLDLAAGEETADPIFVDEVVVPVGRYNALQWQMTPATDGTIEGYSLVLIGTAEKDGEQLAFQINVEESYSNLCGEYVGDTRKGILTSDATADLEMTFHFDHIFGDAELAPDDDLNEAAPGFEPFAALAENGVIETDLSTISGVWAEETYQQLLDSLTTLGHTGEGHCFYGE